MPLVLPTMSIFNRPVEIKITFTKNKGASATQLSRVIFYDSNSSIVVPTLVTNPNGDNPTNETAEMVLNDSGKWLDRVSAPSLVFSFPFGSEIAGYEFFTANDEPSRDPCAWSIYEKESNGEWQVLTCHHCEPPVKRNCTYGKFSLRVDDGDNLVFSMDIIANNGAPVTQLAHVAFYDAAGNQLTPLSVRNEPKGVHPPGETPDKLITMEGKWLNKSVASRLVFCFAPGTEIACYEPFTANDCPERDPTAWTIRLSRGLIKNMIHNKQVSPPAARFTSYGRYALEDSPTMNQRRLNTRYSYHKRATIPNVDATAKKSAPSTYQIKFLITKNAGDRMTQLSSIVFYDSKGNVVHPVSVRNPGGDNPPNETPEMLLQSEGKWLDRNASSTLIFDFDIGTGVYSYEMFTGNDFPKRDPTAWIVFKGVNENWTEMESRECIAPSDRISSYGPMNFTAKAMKPSASVSTSVVFPPPTMKVTSSSDGKYPCHHLMGPEAYWNSGKFAPQWVQLDLGSPFEISVIKMMVDQHPSGYTKHEIYCKESIDSEEVNVATIAGDSHKGEHIEVYFAPMKVQFIRIHSVESPSWIAWRNVQVANTPCPLSQDCTSAILRFN